MGKNDRVELWTETGWFQLFGAMRRVLERPRLPREVTDKQLVDLMTACGNARQRLRE